MQAAIILQLLTIKWLRPAGGTGRNTSRELPFHLKGAFMAIKIILITDRHTSDVLH